MSAERAEWPDDAAILEEYRRQLADAQRENKELREELERERAKHR